jgi:hypothetical protein
MLFCDQRTSIRNVSSEEIWNRSIRIPFACPITSRLASATRRSAVSRSASKPREATATNAEPVSYAPDPTRTPLGPATSPTYAPPRRTPPQRHPPDAAGVQRHQVHPVSLAGRWSAAAPGRQTLRVTLTLLPRSRTGQNQGRGHLPATGRPLTDKPASGHHLAKSRPRTVEPRKHPNSETTSHSTVAEHRTGVAGEPTNSEDIRCRGPLPGGPRGRSLLPDLKCHVTQRQVGRSTLARRGGDGPVRHQADADGCWTGVSAHGSGKNTEG